MSSYYSNESAPKERAKNIAYGVSGTTLSTILMGVNPILGTIGYALTGIVTLGKYIKNKAYANSNTAMNDYFANSTSGDTVRLNYRIDRKGNVNVNLPGNMTLPKNVQTHLDLIRNGNNCNYELVLEKIANGNYKLRDNLKDHLNRDIVLGDFNLGNIKYQNTNRQNNQGNSGQDATETRKEALRRWRNRTPGSPRTRVRHGRRTADRF